MIDGWMLASGIVGAWSFLASLVYLWTHRNLYGWVIFMNGLWVLYFGLLWGLGSVGLIPVETRSLLGKPVGWILLFFPIAYVLLHWDYHRER